MSSKEEKICFVKKGRKLVKELTSQEYEEFAKGGLPTDLEVNIKEKSSSNTDPKIINEYDSSEVSPEELETIRLSDAEEQNNA